MIDSTKFRFSLIAVALSVIAAIYCFYIGAHIALFVFVILGIIASVLRVYYKSKDESSNSNKVEIESLSELGRQK
jgi:hypothetical protein